jgi:hypothetical protein
MEYNTAQTILDSWLSTEHLVGMVMNRLQYGSSSRYVWQVVDSELDGAKAYYASIPEDERRGEAAEALAAGGWDMRKINYTLG